MTLWTYHMSSILSTNTSLFNIFIPTNTRCLQLEKNSKEAKSSLTVKRIHTTKAIFRLIFWNRTIKYWRCCPNTLSVFQHLHFEVPHAQQLNCFKLFIYSVIRLFQHKVTRSNTPSKFARNNDDTRFITDQSQTLPIALSFHLSYLPAAAISLIKI